jgi:hypothetical protein
LQPRPGLLLLRKGRARKLSHRIRVAGIDRARAKKAASAAKSKKTIAHLSSRTRTALGKQGAKMARKAARRRR